MALLFDHDLPVEGNIDRRPVSLYVSAAAFP